MYEGDGFSTKTLGKAYFTIKLTGRAMVWPASFDTWKAPYVFKTHTGADPGFFLGGGALVSCSISTPINHIVFFFSQNTSCIRKPQVISGGGRTPCTLPLDPPLSQEIFVRGPYLESYRHLGVRLERPPTANRQ